jgi:hypothetical protein
MSVRHRRYSDVHRNGRRTFATFNPVPSPPITDRSVEAFFRHDPSLSPPRRARCQRQPAPYARPYFSRLRSRLEFVFFRCTDPFNSTTFTSFRTTLYVLFVIVPALFGRSDFARVGAFYFTIIVVVNFDQCFPCALWISRSQPSAPVLRPCVPTRQTRTCTLLTRSPVWFASPASVRLGLRFPVRQSAVVFVRQFCGCHVIPIRGLAVCWCAVTRECRVNSKAANYVSDARRPELRPQFVAVYGLVPVP